MRAAGPQRPGPQDSPHHARSASAGPEPNPPPQPGVEPQGCRGQPHAPALGDSPGWGQAGPWASTCAQLSRPHGQEGLKRSRGCSSGHTRLHDRASPGRRSHRLEITLASPPHVWEPVPTVTNWLAGALGLAVRRPVGAQGQCPGIGTRVHCLLHCSINVDPACHCAGLPAGQLRPSQALHLKLFRTKSKC